VVKPKVAAIIQARMGSSRFPGKVLRHLAGEPVLWHIIYRLKKCQTVDVIAVATSVNPVDDLLEEFCKEQGVFCVRGSEDNVLDRYRQAAESLEADVIIRITGDAPLVDPEIIDRLVKHLLKENADYCTGDPDTPTIHEGFSPFTREALERLVEKAADDPAAVEHVTAYFKEHPDRFHTVYVRLPEAHNFPDARISVDTPADLKFLEEVYQRLEVPAGEADITDVVKLLKAAPELLDINSGVRQKTAREKTRRAIIRCDGDSVIGLGHVVRCLALAEELREVHSWGVTFAMERGEIGIRMVTEAGFDIKINPDAENEGEWLEKLMDSLKPDAFIMDIRTDLDRVKVAELKRFGPLIVDIDDPSDRRLEADMVFYPPVPKVKQMDWSGFKGHLFTGWEWVILRRQFADPPKPSKQSPNDPPIILVTMGGSDPAGMTLKTAEALESVKAPFKALFVIGSAHQSMKTLKDFLATVKYPYEVKSGVKDMAALMTGVDLAVASFGVTAYELSVVGIPALYLCLTEDHRIAADFFERSGIGVNLGCHFEINGPAISRRVEELLKDAGRRRDMASIASSKVDGQGAGRIAKLIADLTDEKFGKS
jgi:spore coat polysaccharide biosynthesis protein SpsF